MTKNMQFKYIIPLALSALMVVAVMPVHASPSHQISDAYSIVNTNFAVQWETPTTDNVDIDSGDIVYWNARWNHNDANYAGNYYLGSDVFNGVYGRTSGKVSWFG